MFRRLAIAALLVAAPLAAQAPAGWHMRLDRSTSASDPDNTPDVQVMGMSGGFHVVSGPAAVLWKDDNKATGSYTVSGRFMLNKPSGHNNYYGLVFGGANLADSTQSYIYFLIGQNGTYLVKHRGGNTATHDVQARTPHEAIKKPEGSGSSVNTLEVRVAGDKIDYYINGTMVHSTPRSGYTARTDGIWGVRINHQLDVMVDQLMKK